MTDNTYPDLNAVDNIYRQNKAIMDAAAKADRTKAMDALIAGDADLYDALDGLMAHKPDYADTLWQNASEALENASARIKGDKDRATQSSAPTDLVTAAKVVVGVWAIDRDRETERMDKAIHRLSVAIDLTPALLETAPDVTNELLELAHQYLSDLRYPPAQDSKERRIERIEAMLKKVQP